VLRSKWGGKEKPDLLTKGMSYVMKVNLGLSKKETVLPLG